MCKVALQMSNWIQISTKQKNTIYFPHFVHRDHLVLHLAYPDGEGCAESLLLQQSPWISLDPNALHAILYGFGRVFFAQKAATPLAVPPNRPNLS